MRSNEKSLICVHMHKKKTFRDLMDITDVVSGTKEDKVLKNVE